MKTISVFLIAILLSFSTFANNSETAKANDKDQIIDTEHEALKVSDETMHLIKAYKQRIIELRKQMKDAYKELPKDAKEYLVKERELRKSKWHKRSLENKSLYKKRKESK